jgi:acetyl esterase/lipase
MNMKSRAVATFALLLVLAGAVNAQTAQTTRAELSTQDAFLEIATFPLWEGDAPGALGKARADVPTLTLFRPWGGSGNGTAVIIAPGGAYLGLAANHEGRQVADWFTSRGVTAFVLKYRLGRKYLFPIPLTDAQRAIRLVRSRAKEFGIVPDRVGMIGFSAGGHLTASAGTMFDAGKPDSPDPIERLGSRPDFVILGYAWLNAMKPDQKGALAYCGVMGIAPEKCKSFEQYSPDQRVSAQTPPAFIYHTSDDEAVPVDASVTFYRSLRAAGVPAEMHIFAKGKHGSGLGLGDAALDLWPTLLEAWLRDRGLLTPHPEIVAAAQAAQKAAAPPGPRSAGAPFSINLSVKELLANADAKAVLVNHLGQGFLDDIPEFARIFSLAQLSQHFSDTLTPDKLQAIERDLAKVPIPR